MSTKRFHRHFPTKGYPLYWMLLAYLVIGWFYPVVGLLALICMIAPVAFAVRRGRWWCGNACPRGSFYDRVLSEHSPHRPHSTVCPHIRFPSVHGDVHIHRLRRTDVLCMGRLERHGACVLEHHPCDNRRGHSPLVRLCSPDMVFLLSYGHAIVVCIAKTIPVALRLYQYPRCRHMSDEVQELCQSLPDAAHAIRLPWYSNRLS